MERYLGALLIVMTSFLFQQGWMGTVVLAEAPGNQPVVNDSLPASQPLHTESRFSEKLEESREIIAKSIVYQDDPQVDAEIEKVIDEGVDGKKTIITKVTYFEGKPWKREVISTEVTIPKDKQILRGTKIVWKSIQTPEGEIRYWKKMRVYATHYDSRCPGCNEWTAIGMKAGKGVIAVDPKVINLRSKIYVPGYGVAVAGDTGGAIKGNIIDLGFDDARIAGWRARFIDIYLL
ncbi:MAG: G5 domain-containing protein [Candidatus Daviesbacteria bacterium]|nr:MAG: G5 domain-containing protein [Candidatus Daviesbacteria bacterium]